MDRDERGEQREAQGELEETVEKAMKSEMDERSKCFIEGKRCKEERDLRVRYTVGGQREGPDKVKYQRGRDDGSGYEGGREKCI